MEFKRAFLSPRQIHNCAVPKRVWSPWDKLVNQITEVKQGVGRNLDYKDYEDRTYFIGMQINTLLQRSKNPKTIKSTYVNEFTQVELRDWAQQVNPRPDAVFAWRIASQKHRICPISWSKDEKETKWVSFPAICFASQ